MQKLAIAVSNNVSFQNFPKDRVVVKLSEAEMTETSVVLMFPCRSVQRGRGHGGPADS